MPARGGFSAPLCLFLHRPLSPTASSPSQCFCFFVASASSWFLLPMAPMSAHPLQPQSSSFLRVSRLWLSLPTSQLTLNVPLQEDLIGLEVPTRTGPGINGLSHTGSDSLTPTRCPAIQFHTNSPSQCRTHRFRAQSLKTVSTSDAGHKSQGQPGIEAMNSGVLTTPFSGSIIC